MKAARAPPSLRRILTAFFITLIVALPFLSVHPVLAPTIFEDGFESGDFSKWYPIGGHPTVTSGNAHHGTYKAVLDCTYEYAQARFTLTPIGHGFMRAYVKFKSFPTSGKQTAILGLFNWGSYRYMAEARVINVAGTLKWALRYYHNGAHYLAVSEQQKPTMDTWYCVEVEAVSNTATNAESRIYINGNELTDISKTGKNNPYTITCAYIWVNCAGVTQWYDCIIVDTDYIGPECTLTVNVAGSGTVAKTPDQDPYMWGTNVTLTATPTTGWSFAHWSGDASGTANPITVNMTGDKTILATFTQDTYTLSISVVGSGSVNLNNSGPYHYGDVIELTAVPSAGWSFESSWSGDLSGSANPATIMIDGDKVVTATFTQITYTLSVPPVGNGAVNVNNSGPYHYGDTVELTAVPAVGWSFQGWSGDLSGSANPATIVIDGDKTVTATFTQNFYTLTVNIVGSGSVNLNNTGPYYYGDIVELTANTDPGWAFSHWSGDLTGSVNPATITIDGDKTVTATFVQEEYTLAIIIGGSGSVNLNKSGPYHYGDVVELTANADLGWTFIEWTGDLTGSENPATIVITGSMTVAAAFAMQEYSLTVNIIGNGAMNANATGPYHYGDVVELTANPDFGWSFQGWGGDLSGSANPATIVMDGNKAVTATFIQDTYTLSVSTIGSGSVSLNNSGPYNYGDVVKLTANSAVGWSFQGWSGDLSGSANPATIVIDGDKTVTATFTQTFYTLTITVIGSGSVTRSNSGPYHYGDSVGLTAVPDAGWIFDHWSGDLSGSANPATIQITGNKVVTATFTASAPVGGHSIHISIGDTAQPVATYSVLICLFGAMLAILRRKRK